MNLIEQLEARNGAMKVSELCELLGVDDKHIYRMATRGLNTELPCERSRVLRPSGSSKVAAIEIRSREKASCSCSVLTQGTAKRCMK